MPAQKVRVMLVDDSSIIRGMVGRALDKIDEIEVVASVHDGQAAVDELEHTDVDLILLDIEMPRMDGITALPLLLEKAPKAKVIMVSTLTMKGADISMKCLELGASDYIGKPRSGSNRDESESFYRELIRKIRALGGIPEPKVYLEKPAVNVEVPVQKTTIPSKRKYPMTIPKALAIASSTGGPQALIKIFTTLEKKLTNVPIFITQHMPPNFTTILAQNLSRVSGREAVEGIESQKVMPGHIYVAPGGYHMCPKKVDGDVIIKLNQDPEVNFCRPAADPMIDSLVSIYGGNLMLLVLTGMGSDGLNGANNLKKSGGFVVAQDEKTSSVWGMPKAIVDNNLHDVELPIDDIAPYVIRAFGEGM